MAERWGGHVKLSTIRRDFDKLREAIRSHNAEAAEAAWLNCERWLPAVEGLSARDDASPSAAALVLLESPEAVERMTLSAANDLWPLGPEQYEYDPTSMGQAIRAALRSIAGEEG